MAAKRRTLVIAVILLIVGGILGAYFGGLLSLAPPDYDPNTVKLHDKERGLVVQGAMDDPSFTGRRQLVDSPQYITSWKPTGNSEGVVFEAQICLDFSGAFLRNGYVKVQTSKGGSWADYKDYAVELPSVWGFSGCSEYTKAIIFSFTGEINGWVRVVFYAELWDIGPNVFDGDVTHDLIYSGPWIRDDAVLVSGRGTITSPTELTVFEVGQTVRITVDLGSACSKKSSEQGEISSDSGYTLELYSSGQGKTVKTWDLPCGPGTFSVDKSGAKLEYTILASDFASEPGNCKNTMSLKLLNDLFLKDQTDIKTIDLKALQPPPPTIEVTVQGGVWEEGKTVTIKVLTNETGALVNIIVENRETGVRILEKNAVAQLSFDVVPPTAGTYMITVSIEANCRASDPVQYVMVIEDSQPPIYTPTGGGFAFPIWAILVIIAIIAMLLAWFIPVFGLRMKIILFMFGILLIVIAVLVFPK